MGVNIYALGRRYVRLTIEGLDFEVGSLKLVSKLTEVDTEGLEELKLAEKDRSGRVAPYAALVSDPSIFPIFNTSAEPATAKAHLVIGWEADRFQVTDLEWDFLPVIGYGVWNSASDTYALHEMTEGVLWPMTRFRADSIGIIDEQGQLIRRGQPLIEECRMIRVVFPGYIEACCKLSNNLERKLFARVDGADLPTPEWFVGKRPSEVGHVDFQ